MKKIFLYFFLCCYHCSSGQDGRIVSIAPHAIEDSDKRFFEKRFADTDSILDHTALQEIVYLSDGLKISGYIASPKGGAGKYPCIIYCRGGNRELGSLTSFEQFYLQRMAAWGYVVIASQYRGGPGSEGGDEFGGKDIDDVLNLLPALERISFADTSRVGIYGWSRGGMMTYLAMKRTNRFKAAIVGAGLADLYNNITMRKDSFEYYVYAECIPGYWKNKDAELQRRSAVYWADSLCKTTPLLLMQGSSDWRVTPDESLELVDKLYKARQPVKFIFYPGGDHGLREYTRETDAESRKWLDDYVRDKKSLPNMEKHGR